jgi:DNA-binding transcriptional MerR regulator
MRPSVPQPEGLREVPYLSTGQVAEVLGVTKKTIKNWLKSSLIPEPHRNPSNRYRRWTLQDIECIRRILSHRNDQG